MKTSVKKLSLGDLIFHRQGSFIVRLVYAVFGFALCLFFRRIELVNAENLPEKSGLIFVSNHPNALIDPALVFIALPRRIAFLAKSTLFKMPFLGFLIRAVGALPLYRQQDAGADVSRNQETFNVARELLKSGGAIALFPEGVSHNSPKLLPLKTGAARIALGAASVGRESASLDLRVVPVGLFYTNKTTFRSEALLHFGEPFPVLPVALDAGGQPPKDAVKRLTAQIEEALRRVTLNAESEAELSTARIAAEVFTSTTPEEENLAERLALLQKFVAGGRGANDENLEKRLAEYDKKLDEHGIEPEFLALAQYSKWFIFRQALRRLWKLLIFSPLAILGIILHFPAYQAGKFLAFLQTRKGDYDMASTVKVLASIVLMPVTWIVFAVVLYFYFGWQIALVSLPFSFLCGYVALRTLEEIAELSGWAKAILLFIRKREKFLRLLAERQKLFEKVKR
ncbi:MAG TPA: lysophospholipid acyltransferase family protein [Pyrinomonadaceae bacterium]|jgi:1-acyl-sn-glycerol-3-phosphate acyltransferase